MGRNYWYVGTLVRCSFIGDNVPVNQCTHALYQSFGPMIGTQVLFQTWAEIIGTLVHWLIGSLVHWRIGTLVHVPIMGLIVWYIGTRILIQERQKELGGYGCTHTYICYPPHVPTLFGLETLEHGYFRSRTCIQVPRQSASVQPARTLWTTYGKPKSRILELLLLKFAEASLLPLADTR